MGIESRHQYTKLLSNVSLADWTHATPRMITSALEQVVVQWLWIPFGSMRLQEIKAMRFAPQVFESEVDKLWKTSDCLKNEVPCAFCHDDIR